MYIVMSNTGKWVFIEPPKGHDPSWQTPDHMRYAVMFQASIEKGIPPARAEQIAEAAVNCRLYPGLVYCPNLEQDLQ